MLGCRFGHFSLVISLLSVAICWGVRFPFFRFPGLDLKFFFELSRLCGDHFDSSQTCGSTSTKEKFRTLRQRFGWEWVGPTGIAHTHILCISNLQYKRFDFQGGWWGLMNMRLTWYFGFVCCTPSFLSPLHLLHWGLATILPLQVPSALLGVMVRCYCWVSRWGAIAGCHCWVPWLCCIQPRQCRCIQRCGRSSCILAPGRQAA